MNVIKISDVLPHVKMYDIVGVELEGSQELMLLVKGLGALVASRASEQYRLFSDHGRIYTKTAMKLQRQLIDHLDYTTDDAAFTFLVGGGGTQGNVKREIIREVASPMSEFLLGDHSQYFEIDC